MLKIPLKHGPYNEPVKGLNKEKVHFPHPVVVVYHGRNYHCFAMRQFRIGLAQYRHLEIQVFVVFAQNNLVFGAFKAFEKARLATGSVSD